MTKTTLFPISLLLLIVLLIDPASCLGQNEYSAATLTGKWERCTGKKRTKDFQCGGEQFYEFFADGTYQLHVTGVICNGQQVDIIPGTWTLDNNILTLKEDSWCSVLIAGDPQLFKIVWVNEFVFYSKDREGPFGRKVYTYFTRRP